MSLVECMQLLMFEEMVCTVEHASYVYKSGCDCFILSLTTFLKWYCLAHIYLSCSLSPLLSCHANCLTLRGVNVLSLAVRNFRGRRFFLLEMVPYVPLIVCQDKTEIFSLVHTNIVESGMTVKVLL
jgi:hypothetical protein